MYANMRHFGIILAPDVKNSTRATALVMIEDVNDHSPVFQSRPGVTVMEDEPVGYPLLHVIATDDDSHEAGRVTYAIASGNEKGHFVIDANSGELSLSWFSNRQYDICQ